MPIAMSNADGSPNKQKVATHVAQIHLQFPKYDHEEYLEALVLELGHNQMLLGIIILKSIGAHQASSSCVPQALLKNCIATHH